MNRTWPHGAVRAEAMRWAADLAADPCTVYLDTETTGFGAGAEIVDIAIVDGAGRVLLDSLVRPVNPIPVESSAVHGIYDHHVVDARSWPDVCAEALALLAGRPVVVYNAPFDRAMLGHCCGRHGIAWDAASVRWECAMREYAKYRGVRNPTRGGWAWQKLEIAAVQIGSRPGGHRALADALVCRDVVIAMAEGR
jgi:DNA polymerase III epsilon subunit-like protein